jgi:predicted  nucleic acid-binding Zn-ribbon protein
MLINGSFGFSRASSELQDSLDKYQRLEDKTTEYESLTAQLENTISYDEAYAALEEMQSEHDSDASQHRTDLATHTATLGGYTMAVQVINDSKVELAEAKAELADGKAALETQEKQFEESSAAFEQQKPALTAAIATAQSGAEYFTAAGTNADSALATISTAKANEPTNPVEVQEPGDDASDEDEEAYQQYLSDKATHDAWEMQVKYSISSDLMAMADNAQQGAAIMNAVTSQLPESMTGGSDSTTSMDTSNIDFTSMSVDEISATLVQMKSAFAQAAATPATLQTALDTAQAQIDAGAQAIAAAKYQITTGEAAIAKGEQELQHQLELLWYNMGQLDDETADLESTKQRLDEEADAIAKQLITVDEQKTLEQKQRSARIILMKEDNIEEAVNAGGDLADSAKSYIRSGRDEAQSRYSKSVLMYVLAVVGGALGILSIFGSFEILKGRASLLLPTLLCLLCSIGAEALNFNVNNVQLYTATFVIVAAVLHGLFIIPKNKIPT